MLQQKKTTSKIIANAVAFLLALGVYVGFIFVQDILIQKSLVLRSTITTVELGESRIFAIKQLTNSLGSTQETVRGYVLSADEVVPFLQRLEAIMQHANVVGETERVATTASSLNPAGKWEFLEVAISTEGSWAATYEFLTLLEHIPYYAEVTNVVVEKVANEENTYWAGTFTLRVLKQAESL